MRAKDESKIIYDIYWAPVHLAAAAALPWSLDKPDNIAKGKAVTVGYKHHRPRIIFKVFGVGI